MGSVIRFPSKQSDGTIEARRDGLEVCITLKLPSGFKIGDELVAEPSAARAIAQSLMSAAYEAEQTAKAKGETDAGYVNVSLYGTSRTGERICVDYVQAMYKGHTPFTTWLRVTGPAIVRAGVHTKHVGEEFEVHTATGEEVGRKPGRRWWQVEKTHLERLPRK